MLLAGDFEYVKELTHVGVLGVDPVGEHGLGLVLARLGLDDQLGRELATHADVAEGLDRVPGRTKNNMVSSKGEKIK